MNDGDDGDNDKATLDHDAVKSKDNLMELFRPLLKDFELDESDRVQLVEFFRRNHVTKLSGLAIFDPMTLWEKRTECDLFDSELFSMDFGDICHYFAIVTTDPEGTSACDKGFVQYTVDRHYNDKHWEQQVDGLSQVDFDRLSYFSARSWLAHLFGIERALELMNDAGGRRIWLERGALQLLERYPILAAHVYEGADDFEWYPFFYFLCSGFGKDIVQQVHSYYPKVSLLAEKHITPSATFLDMARDDETRVPLEVLKLMLELDPKLAAKGKYCGLFFEKLFSQGYNADTLEHVRSYLPKDVNVLCLRQETEAPHDPLYSWELDLGKAIVIAKILPQLRELEFRVPRATSNAFVHFLNVLSSGEQPNLELVCLGLPMDTINMNEEVKRSLRRFIEKKGAVLKRLFICDAHNAGGAMVFMAQRGACLEVISRGIQCARGGWHLEELTLDNCFFDANAVAALFSQDIIGSLDIQLGSKHYQRPWDTPKKTDGLRLEQVNLHNIKMFTETFVAMWQRISKLTRIESILFAPGDNMNRPSFMLHPLEAISLLPKLKTICLGPHGGDVSIDITSPLTSMLRHGCLEFLQVEGSSEDHDEDDDDATIGCHAYSIDTKRLCHSLKDDKTLRFLFLRGVDLEGTNVTRSFLNVLQEHNNTTIEFADICDDTHFYTIIPKDSWRRDIHHGFTYESYVHAWQIYYLTSFNRFGRGKVQDKSTTVKDLVELLVGHHAGIGLESNEEEFYPQILKLATEPDASPTEHLTQLYEKLLCSPESWYNAVKRDIEALAMRYGLLRETPCLWCVRDLRGGGRGRKRKTDFVK